MNSDFKDLLAVLTQEEVKYLIVGGYAVIHYAQPRYTKDLDIWLEPPPKNAKHVMSAFASFGISAFGLNQRDFESEGTQLSIGVPPVAIDFLTSLPGLDFQSAWNNREITMIGNTSVNYLSKSDLISSKRVASRVSDLADLEALEQTQ